MHYIMNLKEELIDQAALPNLKTQKLHNNIIFSVLDVEKYAHKFTFPAPGKTCGYADDYMVRKMGGATHPYISLRP